MGKPRLRPGTAGNLNVAEITDAAGRVTAYRVRCRYRTALGQEYEAKGQGPTLRQAIERLDASMARRNVYRSDPNAPGAITGRTTLAEITPLAMDWLQGKVDETTRQTYMQHAKGTIALIGELSLSEIEADPALLDEWIEQLRRPTKNGGHGYSVHYARNAKYALWNVCEFARRKRAITRNPIKNMGRIKSSTAELIKTRQSSRALDPEEMVAYLEAVDADQSTRDPHQDLSDLLRFLFLTGVRISEALAFRWSDINWTDQRALMDGERVPARSLFVTGNMVHIHGQGLVREDGKTFTARRAIPMGDSLYLMLSLRLPDREAVPEHVLNNLPIFPSSVLTYRSPHNVRRAIRSMHARIAANTGVLWAVTPKTGRKTVATLLAETGDQTSQQIARLLGHSNPAMTEAYIRRVQANPDAAQLLDDLHRPKEASNA